MTTRHKLPPLMCLTQDGLALDHLTQARRLCEAGAGLVQLRMKHASAAERLHTAREVARICADHDSLCIVNDHPHTALEARAHGVHLGKTDMDWRQARTLLGPDLILGGTVNDADAAERARECGVLDYVGLGPLRFTSTKEKLAPVLGFEGIAELLPRMGGLPAWVIGGVTAADLPRLRRDKANGAAVCSLLYRGERIEENLRGLLEAWEENTLTSS